MRISDWSSDVCSSDLREPSEDTAQAIGAERLALQRELGLEAAAHQRAYRPRQCREQDDAEGDYQRRVEPGGVDAGGRGLEHHEGLAGVDAPAHDAALLDFGSTAFPRTRTGLTYGKIVPVRVDSCGLKT